MPWNDPKTLWWQHAVCYQVYVRSFADADGDGVGDLAGITSRLPHLRDLGVDALWITPFYTSPQKDHGYDVADYTDVDPLFGTIADADDLIARAHELDLRVIVDVVPNHTSDQHAWFRAALEAGPGSRERARYHFRDVDPAAPDTPPNNWESVFGGSAWTKVPDPRGDQWYLHLFDASQPDLDWRNPEVADLFDDVLRFWLDRGVDGFRVDVAHGLHKEVTLRDQVRDDTDPAEETRLIDRRHEDEPMWDQPEVHEVYRRWRRVLDAASTPGRERIAVAEAWTRTPESMAAFVRPDELHQAFNFAWLMAPWSAAAFAEVVTHSLAAVEPVGALPTWVLSNHDVDRHVSRYGGGERGLARARAATLTMLALPGSAYLYQGEELGLEQVDVAPEDRQDPVWFRTGEVGRDGCRVPVPWSGTEPPFGFGPGAGQPWIPQPAEWKALTVEAQLEDDDSTLAFYRRALAARREHATPLADDIEVVSSADDVLVLRRGPLTVVVNCSDRPVPLPAGDLVVASSPVTGATLPPDTAAWLV